MLHSTADPIFNTCLNGLTIAQISDTHIDATARPSSYTQQNVREQLQAVLHILARRELDLLVLSGDLAAKSGEIEAYCWLRAVLEQMACPYIVMAGNHDDVENMARVFDFLPGDITDRMLYFNRSIKGKSLFFLDSASYQIPAQQLDWLSAQVQGMTESALLFIHHPPLLCRCQFMDTYYPLQNIDEVWPRLVDLQPIKHIFCGHYHTDLTITCAGKQVYLTPSTMMQIDRDKPKFTLAHARPGWRMIEWSATKLCTYVEYL